MSTYQYWECLDHTPPLRATEESGQHDYNRADMLTDYRQRALLNSSCLYVWPHDRYRRNTQEFFAAHPHCRLRIITEYGDIYDPETGDHLMTHKTEAEAHLGQARGAATVDDHRGVDMNLQAAQVEALLEIGEQLRVANLVALYQTTGPDDLAGGEFADEAYNLMAGRQVRIALGLDQ